jgi:hypothetical protein
LQCNCTLLLVGLCMFVHLQDILQIPLWVRTWILNSWSRISPFSGQNRKSKLEMVEQTVCYTTWTCWAV